MRPGSLLPIYQKALVIFIVVLVVAAVIFSFIRKKRKGLYSKVWRVLRGFSLSNAIVGLIILFFNYEMVPLLSARFWFVLWGIEMIVWLFFILRMAREIPKKKEQLEKEREFKKYIP
jgi:amino acid transporter